MAAYESFAGESIIRPPGTTGGPPRGGYIPLSEIPNAPRPVQMDLVPAEKYTSMLSGVHYAYQEPVTGFEQRAAKLMQPPLPPGFERAAEARVGQGIGAGLVAGAALFA